MVDFVVDKSLDVLLRQLNEHAPNRSKASDGSIGDAAHASRDSAHNPEDTEDSMDGNDPDHQVDARDFTHDPAHGADMHEFTEQLRVSRDSRLYLVIFDGRQFSSYAKNGIPPYTWRPYTGSDMHRGHAHVQVNDYHNDDTRPWEVFEMAAGQFTAINDADLTALASRVLGTLMLDKTLVNKRVIEAGKLPDVPLINELAELFATVKDLQSKMNLVVATLRDVASDVDALTIPQPAPVDPAALRPVVEEGVRAVLKNGVDQA